METLLDEYHMQLYCTSVIISIMFDVYLDVSRYVEYLYRHIFLVDACTNNMLSSDI